MLSTCRTIFHEMRQNKQVKGLVALLIVALGLSTPAFATDFPASPSYRFDETSIGLTNNLESSSANYRDQSGAGDTATGAASSANFQTQAGSDTSNDPNLTFSMNTSSANFGAFSP